MAPEGPVPGPAADPDTAAGPAAWLPPMHAILAEPPLPAWEGRVGRARVRAAAAAVLEAWRRAARERGGDGGRPSDAAARRAHAVRAAEAAARLLEEERSPGLRRVVNATGVVLHTGLGRAPLAPEAVAAVAAVAGAYSNLELDLAGGGRGDRHAAVRAALRELVGAPSALVVNNNAAAVLLALTALAAGREVVIGRGELVEIGGGFRVPEVLAQSGARLREVGTTNRTYAQDYAAAVGPDTALLLRVHPSNFRIVGFTERPPLRALAALAEARGLPLVYDMGSGAVAAGGAPAGGGAEFPEPEGTGDVDLAQHAAPAQHRPGAGWLAAGSADALADPPDVAAALRAGASLVCFSGDKLLGGPQAGILCGREDLIAQCARHPLCRALRVDKMTLAALEATLDLYRSGRAAEAVPTLAMLARPAPTLRREAEALAAAMALRLGASCAVALEPAESAAGGGALPAVGLPTTVVALRPAGGGAEDLAATLRHGVPAVVARVRAGAVLIDPRALLPGDADLLPGLVAGGLARAGTEAERRP